MTRTRTARKLRRIDLDSAPGIDRSLLPEFLREADEDALGAADVAEPVGVAVAHHLVDDLRAVVGDPGERRVEVVHGEPHAQVRPCPESPLSPR